MKTTAQLYKALSEEPRLRIINLLFQGELCVCDLIEILKLPQSTISRHLAYLRNCGLVTDRRQGAWMYYRLKEESGDFQQQQLRLLQQHLSALASGNLDRSRLEQRLIQKTDHCGGLFVQPSTLLSKEQQ